MDKTLWQDAAAFAANAHRNQTRYDKRPYVSHCFRVAMTVHLVFGFDDPAVLAGALLHDTIEDCDVDYDDILEAFGQEVADYVAMMTKDMRLEQTLREIAYDEQLAQGPWQGRLIKLADVYDNFTDSVPKMRTNYIEKANRILTITQNYKQLQGAREDLMELMHEMAKC
jgi:(p)ppGpp synthase/HD superfamily hydrolase